MPDFFSGRQRELDSPADFAAAVTPHDTTPLTATTRAVFVGVEGALTVTMAGGGNVTFATVPAGVILPIRVTHVLDTGTDADSIVALW